MDETQWWNKPLIGETSFSEKIVKLISKKSVPEKVVLAHRKYNREIRAKAWHVQRIELNKFDNEDFLTYAKMRVLIEKELGEFKGLKTE